MGQWTTICLTGEEEQVLRQWARAGTSEHRMVERAKVILLAHQGKSNLEIAEHLNTRPARVSKWLKLDLPSKVKGLGLPLTTITARSKEDVATAS